MRTLNKPLFLAILGFVFIFQSCVKNPLILTNPFQDDKLLLSKVMGASEGPIPWNNFEFYQRDSINKHAFDYLATYSYGNAHSGYNGLRPLQQVSFFNTGSWDFTYNNLFPDEVIDHSIPNLDQGYWKFYYNGKGQIIKTGFAFSTAVGPTEFEFYGYDEHDNLTDLVYGKHVDTPFYKLTFAYDAGGNLTQWQYLFPTGFANSTTAALQSFSAVVTLPKAQRLVYRPIDEATKRFAAKNTGKQTLSANNYSFKIPPTRLVGDSNVIYQNYLTAYITNDGKINPFHQQGGLLFFVSSRNYSADIDANFWQLQKSNPIQIQYILNPDFGPETPMVSSFTYTYNNWGYPTVSHESTYDTDGVWYIPGETVTQDRQIEYIKNN